MICPYCGGQNADWARGCAMCGRALPAVQQVPVQAQNQPPFPPPPPPDLEPRPQPELFGPAAPSPVLVDNSLPARKRNCPGCGEKVGMRYARTSCMSCGTIYHSKCFSTGSITFSSKTAIMLFPHAKKKIVDAVVNAKLQEMSAANDVQRNENKNKLLMIPEEDLIQGTNQTFCKLCVPMIRDKAPKLARDLEKAGRHEDAGRLFEEFGMIDAAGSARKKGKAQVVTNISVDLNQLLERLKSGGLVSVYKCPNCGGSIKISGTTSTQKLSKCEYCGTVLQTDDLVNFIRDILS